MIDQDLTVLLIVILLLCLAFAAVLVFMASRLRLGARFWARWFRQRQGGTLIIVGLGTFGARNALRMVKTFAAARATNEVVGVILADFHQEVHGYAGTIGKILGKKRVIAPSSMPPGAGQGFMHKLEHDWRTEEIWRKELERMVSQIRRLNAANGSTVTTICYILPPWSGHLPIALSLTWLLKQTFRKPVLHVGHINLPAKSEAELRSNMLLRPEYPANLGLDGIIVSDDDLDPHREIHDWAIASGLAGLFAANRVDPGQQHGANPIHGLVEFAKESGGLVGIGVGQGSTALIPGFLGLRRDIPEQDLSIDTAMAIQQALSRKAWNAPDRREDAPHFISVVVPLHAAHPQWRNDAVDRHARLRVDAIKDLSDGRLPDGCSLIWTSAAIDSGSKDSAPIFALWLYPIAQAGVSFIPQPTEADSPILNPEPNSPTLPL